MSTQFWQTQFTWLTNQPDYRKQEHRRKLPLVHFDDGLPEEMTAAEWDAWISDKIIGPPKATDAYTSEELAAMGIVGIYARKDTENAEHQDS